MFIKKSYRFHSFSIPFPEVNNVYLGITSAHIHCHLLQHILQKQEVPSSGANMMISDLYWSLIHVY